MDLSAIVYNTNKIVKGIRDYSKQQRNVWQRVPLLALNADGITGYSDIYSRAYNQGFWALEGSINSGKYRIFVDLATGELVNAEQASSKEFLASYNYDKQSVLTRANDEDILNLAFHMEELKARKIASELIRISKQPYWKGYDKSKQEQWRLKVKKTLNLNELYFREESQQVE